jgi:hypothetical protein
VIEQDHSNRGADADPLCALSDRGGVDLRRGYDAIVQEQVLGDPNFVVAEVLGELEMPQIGVDRLDSSCWIRDLTSGGICPTSSLHFPLALTRTFTICDHGVSSSEAEGTCFLVKPDSRS